MDDTRAKVDRFNQWCNHTAERTEKNHGHDCNKQYDMVDLLWAQQRVVRQLTEYLDGDEYLAALIECDLKDG